MLLTDRPANDCYLVKLWVEIATKHNENKYKSRVVKHEKKVIVLISNEAESVCLVCRYCTSKSGDRCVAVLWLPPGVVLSVWSSLRQEDTGGRTEMH